MQFHAQRLRLSTPVSSQELYYWSLVRSRLASPVRRDKDQAATFTELSVPSLSVAQRRPQHTGSLLSWKPKRTNQVLYH